VGYQDTEEEEHAILDRDRQAHSCCAEADSC
jgi:hypothetical protein